MGGDVEGIGTVQAENKGDDGDDELSLGFRLEMGL